MDRLRGLWDRRGDACTSSRINAPWLYAPARRVSPGLALLAILGVYLIGWAAGLVSAIRFLLQHGAPIADLT